MRSRKRRRLQFEPLESRRVLAGSVIGDGNPAPVLSTLDFPQSATVQLAVYVDGQDDGLYNNGDVFRGSHCSGSLIADYVVLTAAHCVYNRFVWGSPNRFPTSVFVHAGRDSTWNRPFGEARASFMQVPAGWVSGDEDSWKYDIAVMTLDRNLGDFTGHFEIAALPEKEVVAREYSPSGLLGDIVRTPSLSVPFRPVVNLLHYPGVFGYSQVEQYFSDGPVTDITQYELGYDTADLWTTGGSSGAPLFYSGSYRDVDGPHDLSNTVVGVHVRGQYVKPGESGRAESTRLTPDWIEWINDFITLHANDARTDLPALVDHDGWFHTQESSVSPAPLKVGQPLTATARVFNAGTAAAKNVVVRFRLSYDDDWYQATDRLLGSVTIPTIAPFQSVNAQLSTVMPFLEGGPAHVVWAIDPEDAINEFTTPWHDVRVLAPRDKTRLGSVGNSDSAGLGVTVENLPPSFASSTSQFRVYQGEAVDFDYNAADPENQAVLYRLASTSSRTDAGAVLSLLNGQFHWEPGPQHLGEYTFVIDASDGFARTQLPISVEVVEATPRIGSVAVNRATILDDASELVTLTAADVHSGLPNPISDRVDFYLDLNGNGALDLQANGELNAGADRLLGSDTNGVDGWAWTGAIGGVPRGAAQVFARAMRNSPSYRFWSQSVSATLTVVAAPAVEPYAIPVAGQATQQVTVTPAASSFDYLRAITRDGQGNSYIFSTDQSSYPYVVRCQRIGPNGQPSGASFVLVGMDDVTDVAMRPNGEFIAMYNGWDADGLRMRRYQANGTAIGGVIKFADASYSRNAGIEVATDGSLVLAWGRGGSGDQAMMAQRFSWTGAPIGSSINMSGNPVSGQEAGDLAITPDGRWVAVWQTSDLNNSSTRRIVRARLYDAAGLPLGSEIVVNRTTDASPLELPQVAVNSRGEFVVAYIGNPVGSTEQSVYARRFSATGVAQGDEFRVNTSLVPQARPEAAFSDSGWFAIAWQSSGLDTGDGSGQTGVYAQVYDPQGQRKGPQFRIPTKTPQNQSEPKLVIDGDGDFIAVWQDSFSSVTGNKFSVCLRAYEVNMPPVLNALGQQSVRPGDALTFDAIATDLDGASQTITYTMSGTVPAGAALNPGTGRFTWTPTPDQYGKSYSVAVTATDNGTPAGRADQVVPLVFQSPDMVLVSAAATGTDQLDLAWEIVNGPLPPVPIAFYQSRDDVFSADDLLLSTFTPTGAELSSGSHTRTLPIGAAADQIALPGFGVPETAEDYHVLVVADAVNAAFEDDQDPITEDNVIGMTGVYHPDGGPVYVLGTPGADAFRAQRGSVIVTLNQTSFHYGEGDVTEVRVRLGGSDDRLNAGDLATPVIAWGGSGDDVLTGGQGNDQLDGGPGDDQLLPSPGADSYTSGPSDFAAPVITPLGVTSDTTPSLAWSSIADAVKYELVIEDLAGAQVVNAAGILNPFFTVDSDLRSGIHTTRVRAIGANYRPSAWSQPMVFTVDIPLPDVPVMEAPSGILDTARPTFRWSPATLADSYELRVRRADDGTTVRQATITGDTTFTADVPLPETSLLVSVRAVNEESEFSSWSAALPFEIVLPVPGKPQLLSPVGEIADLSPSFVWTAAPPSTKFELLVQRTSPGSAPLEVIHVVNLSFATENLGAYRSPKPLAAGTYSVQLRAVNDSGEVGSWSDGASFTVNIQGIPPTAPQIFTVPQSAPGANLEFDWTTEPQATSYELKLVRVQGANVSLAASRSGLLESMLSLPHKLPAANYRVSVRSVNAMGYSLWSEAVDFLVSQAGSGPAWQNDRNRFDVNDDQAVAAVDVLLIVNQINTAGTGSLPARLELLPPFFDTSGDDSLSAQDALLVINYINQHVVAAADVQRLPATEAINLINQQLVAAEGEALVLGAYGLLAAPPPKRAERSAADRLRADLPSKTIGPAPQAAAWTPGANSTKPPSTSLRRPVPRDAPHPSPADCPLDAAGVEVWFSWLGNQAIT